MPSDIALIIATLLPAALLVALRINAATVFFSVCLGQILVEYVAKDTDSLITFVAPSADSVSGSTLHLIMLFLPVVFTSLIMLKSVKGRLKATLNALPALGAGATMLLFAVPLATTELQRTIHGLSFWQQLLDAQAMIIGATAFVSLLVMWLARPKAHKDKDAEKHGK